jgi:hypothetical protein
MVVRVQWCKIFWIRCIRFLFKYRTTIAYTLLTSQAEIMRDRPIMMLGCPIRTHSIGLQTLVLLLYGTVIRFLVKDSPEKERLINCHYLSLWGVGDLPAASS